MKNKNVLCFFLIFSILTRGLFGYGNSVRAESIDTGLRVTFSENGTIAKPLPDEPKKDIPKGDLVTIQKKGGFEGGTSVSRKQLPITGEDFTNVLVKLGYLCLLTALVVLLSRRKEDEA